MGYRAVQKRRRMIACAVSAWGLGFGARFGSITGLDGPENIYYSYVVYGRSPPARSSIAYAPPSVGNAAVNLGG